MLEHLMNMATSCHVLSLLPFRGISSKYLKENTFKNLGK